MTKENIKKLKDFFENNSDARVETCKDINSYNGTMEFCNINYIDDLAEYMEAYELARAIIYGDVTNICEPVRFNGYANLENVTDYDIEEESKNYIDEIIDFINENGVSDLCNEELNQFIEEQNIDINN